MTPAPDVDDLSSLRGLGREKLLAALAERFPTASGPGCCAFRGGRESALETLAGIDPEAYARTRNHVDGRVTGLSPWIRHGVLSLAEVRDRALEAAGSAVAAEKLVSELAWRDYWHRVEGSVGERIREAIESPAAIPRRPPAPGLPDDVASGSTGLACIDAFCRRLTTAGHLHNHERMWLASWLVHTRGVDWRSGADWFLRHLVDGDPASNHLSWQWVAGTFSAKPYLARRETIEGCTDGRHCRGCAVRDACPFDGDADAGFASRFRTADPRPPLRIPPAPPWRAGDESGRRDSPLVWVTLDAAAPTAPAARRHPRAPTLFVVDRAWLADERPSLDRLAFLLECLADFQAIRIVVGDPEVEVPRAADALGCDSVAVTETSCPRTRRQAATIDGRHAVFVHRWPRFVDPSAIRDLGRFSRYWQAVRASALSPTPA